MHVISSPSDNGNINIVNADDANNISLEIRGDSNRPDFFQWFNFNLQGETGTTYVLTIENAGKAKYPGWNKHAPYRAYASYGNDEWFFVDTIFEESTGKLVMTLPLQQEHVQIAYFPPYSYAKHLDLIKKARLMPNCEVSTLGKTNGEDGRDITLLTFGTPAEHKKEIWLIARQHPGEPQAEWYAESLIEELAIASPELFEKHTFRVVPNMNPDGTYHGNLRTNKEGNDLNRMWKQNTITMADSPEVFLVHEAMEKIGVNFFMDIHSDEEIPLAFLDEAHLSCPTPNLLLETQERAFFDLYMKLNHDMQNELNYGKKDRANEVNLTMAAASVGHEFNCPSFTLEMPTKNWSWQQCKALAKDFFKVLDAFYKLENGHQAERKLSAPGAYSLLAQKQPARPEAEAVRNHCCNIS